MNSFGFGRYARSGSAAVALLAGCGGSQPPVGVPGAMPQNPAVAPNSTMAHHSGANASSYQSSVSLCRRHRRPKPAGELD